MSCRRRNTSHATYTHSLARFPVILFLLRATQIYRFHKIGAGNPLMPKARWEECDCHALNFLTKLVIIF